LERPLGHPVSVVPTVVVMLLILVVLPVSAVTFLPGVAAGNIARSGDVALQVADFIISPGSTGPVNVGSAAGDQISVGSNSHFNGTVALSQNGGAACSLSVASVTLSASTYWSGYSFLTCTFAAAGNNSVTVTGTSGSLSYSATVTFQVTDFTIAAGPTSVAINAGSPGTSMITVTAINGFTGTVALSQNSGTACSLSGYSVSLTSTTTSGSVTLTCAYAAVGNNSVIVTGTTGGSLSHSSTITVTVTIPKVSEKPPTILGLEPLILYGVIGVLAAVAITGLLALRWRRAIPSPTQPASSLAQQA